MSSGSLPAIDRVVQKIGVVDADIDVNLPWSFGPSVGQLRSQNRFEVVMLAPVRGDRVVDVAGLLVEDRLRIAIFADRAVDRLPDIELFSGSAVIAEREFVALILRW